MKVIINILIILAFISCNPKDGVEINWKDYNVEGKVKMLSEKTIYAKCNADINVNLDTSLNNLTFIQNRYFNRKGLITKSNYFDKDSLMTLKIVYLISRGKIIGTNEFKEGKKKEKMEIKKFNENTYKSITYDFETADTISTSYTHRKDGYIYKQSFESKFSGRIHKTVKYFYRNESGLITEIIDTTKIDNQQFTTNTFVKYLELDSSNNWTKKVEYSNDSICRITIRKLEYY